MQTTLNNNQTRRKLRYNLRYFLHENSNIKRIRNCGAFSFGHPNFRLGGTKSQPHATVAGLETCSSVWSCPVCSAKISTYRKAELSQIINHWDKEMLFITFTIRHNSSQSLKEIWEAMTKAWTIFTSGKGYLLLKEGYGIKHYIKSTEITYSEKNGWHLHLHTVFFMETKIKNKVQFKKKIFTRWNNALSKSNFDCTLINGVDVVDVYKNSGLGSYMAKLSDDIAYEINGSSNKIGKGKSMTMLTVLNKLVDIKKENKEYYRDDEYNKLIKVWHEYEIVSKGKRQITFSKGLKKLANIQDDYSDEEIMELQMLFGKLAFLTNAKDYYDMYRKKMIPGILTSMENNGILYTTMTLLELGYGITNIDLEISLPENIDDYKERITL